MFGSKVEGQQTSLTGRQLPLATRFVRGFHTHSEPPE
jgi:hypothetical protein